MDLDTLMIEVKHSFWLMTKFPDDFEKQSPRNKVCKFRLIKKQYSSLLLNFSQTAYFSDFDDNFETID